MPLETATYITDLNTANPAHTDQLNAADSHMRLIKSVTKATFPNFTSAALASSQAELDAVAHTGQIAAQNGAAGAPSITFKTDATAGFRKNTTTGQVQIEGVLRGPGALPPGAIVDFSQPPPRFTSGGGSTQSATDWLELDGSSYLVASYPDLYAHLGNAYGGTPGSTFLLPNLKDTGRFRRSRTGSVGVGTYQANQNLSHSHTGVTDTTGAHSHNANVNDSGHNHQETGYTGGSSISNAVILGIGTATVATSTNNTTVSFTGITVGIDLQGAHAHNLTINASGGTEARPEAFVVISCIKT